MGVNRISISDHSPILLLCYPVGDALMPMLITLSILECFAAVKVEWLSTGISLCNLLSPRTSPGFLLIQSIPE